MENEFLEQKKDALNMDKSFKQSWDKPIIPLLNLLNERSDTCTISSCSGRIVLMEYLIPDEIKERKYDAKFLFTSHERVKFDDIYSKVSSLEFSPHRTIWFQQEPVILHVRFLELNEDVQELVKIFRSVGFKKSGIFGFEKGKILLEVVGLEIMKVIIMKNGKLLPSKEYFRIMLEEGNKRVERGHVKINVAINKILEYLIRKRVSNIYKFWFGEDYVSHSIPKYRKKELKKLSKQVKSNKFVKRLFSDCEEIPKRLELWKFWGVSEVLVQEDGEKGEEEKEGEDEENENEEEKNFGFVGFKKLFVVENYELLEDIYNHLFRIRESVSKSLWFEEIECRICVGVVCSIYDMFLKYSNMMSKENVKNEEDRILEFEKLKFFRECRVEVMKIIEEDIKGNGIFVVERLVGLILKTQYLKDRKTVLKKIVENEEGISEEDKKEIIKYFCEK